MRPRSRRGGRSCPTNSRTSWSGTPLARSGRWWRRSRRSTRGCTGSPPRTTGATSRPLAARTSPPRNSPAKPPPRPSSGCPNSSPSGSPTPPPCRRYWSGSLGCGRPSSTPWSRCSTSWGSTCPTPPSGAWPRSGPASAARPSTGPRAPKRPSKRPRWPRRRSGGFWRPPHGPLRRGWPPEPLRSRLLHAKLRRPPWSRWSRNGQQGGAQGPFLSLPWKWRLPSGSGSSTASGSD